MNAMCALNLMITIAHCIASEFDYKRTVIMNSLASNSGSRAQQQQQREKTVKIQL